MATPTTAHPARPQHRHGHGAHGPRGPRGPRGRRGRPPGRSADGQVVGVLLMVFGLGWFLRVTGAVELAWESLLSAVLIVLGLGMAITARARTGGIVMVLGILLTFSLATTSSVGELNTAGGVGERQFTVDAAGQLRDDGYRLLAGQLRLDLSELELSEESPRTEPVAASVTFGELIVILPPNIPAEVTVEATGGEIDLLGAETNGSGLLERHVDDDFDEEATGTLTLDLSVTFGTVTVTRAEGDDGATD